jgi:hypothetical protein
MKRWLALAVLLLVGLVSVSCSRPSAKTAGRLTVQGRAEVAATDGSLKQVTRSRTLKAGEQVRVLDGTAMLSLGSGRQLELRKGSVVRLAVQPSPSGQPESRGELVSGDALVVATGDAATLVAAENTIQVTGVARVSRDLAVVVGVYQGAAGVESAGRAVSVPALRQVTVPAPGLPSRATPITFSATDAWDQRYLGDAIDLGNQLASKSVGFSGQVGASPATDAGFFRQILPGLAGEPFDATLLTAARPPGETLVGAAITVLGTKGQFPDRWASVFSFHEELGAPWGLVALDQGVPRAPLLAEIDAAIGRVPGIGGATAPSTPVAIPGSVPVITAPPPAPVSTGGAGGGGGASGGVGAPASTSATTVPPASTGGAGGGGPGTPAGSTGTAVVTAPPLAPRGPLNTGLPVVDDTVNAVVEALTGLLRELGPG